MIALWLSLLLAQVEAASTSAVEPPMAGAEAVSLSVFMESAERMNLDRRISTEQLNRAVAEFHQAWTALLPSMTVTAGYQYNQYPAVISPTKLPPPFDQLPLPTFFSQGATIIPYNQLNAIFRFDLPLVDTQRWMRTAVTSAAEDAARARETLSLDSTRRNTVTSYYGYVAALAVLQSSKETVGVADAQLKLVKIKRDVGTATELEVLRASAELERTRQVVADAQSLAAISARSLRTISGVQPHEKIGMPADDLSPEAGYDELERNVDRLPSVLATDTDYVVAKRQLWSARLALVPTIGAQYSQQFTNATGFQGKNVLFFAGINLTWRLDGPTFSALAVQSALAQTSSLNAEKSRLAAHDQIHADWQRLNAAITKVKAAESQVIAARKAAEVARDRYASGAAAQIDVITADRDVFAADVGQIQARTDLAIARASLRISAGLALERGAPHN